MESATPSDQLRYPLLPQNPDVQSTQLSYPVLPQNPEHPAIYPPLEPVRVQESEPGRLGTSCKCECKKGCGYILGFIILQVLVLVCELITLFSSKWLSYCFWDFCLLYGKSDSDRFDESGSFFELEDEYCDSDHTQKSAINDYCPMFCSNIWTLALVSWVMFCIGILTLLASLPAIYIHIKALVTEEYKSPNVHWTTVVPLTLWVVGWGSYYIGTLSLHDLNKKHHDSEDDHAETELGKALCMSIGISILQLFLFLYVRFLTRKSFL